MAAKSVDVDLDALKGKSAESIEQAAVRDHQNYFSRVSVDFGATL